MPVRFNFGAAEWRSFTAFLEFRRRVAAELGVALETMEGFGGRTRWSAERDPLTHLLSMSDVWGSVRIKDCLPVAERLRVVVQAWPEDDPDRPLAVALAEGLELAARAKVRFRVLR